MYNPEDGGRSWEELSYYTVSKHVVGKYEHAVVDCYHNHPEGDREMHSKEMKLDQLVKEGWEIVSNISGKRPAHENGWYDIYFVKRKLK